MSADERARVDDGASRLGSAEAIGEPLEHVNFEERAGATHDLEDGVVLGTALEPKRTRGVVELDAVCRRRCDRILRDFHLDHDFAC